MKTPDVGISINIIGKVVEDNRFRYNRENPPTYFLSSPPVPGAKQTTTYEEMTQMTQSLKEKKIHPRKSLGGGAVNATFHTRTALGREGQVRLFTSLGEDHAGSFIRGELDQREITYQAGRAEGTPVALVLEGLEQGERETRIYDPDQMHFALPNPQGGEAVWLNSISGNWQDTAAEVLGMLPEQTRFGLTLGTKSINRRGQQTGDETIIRQLVERSGILAQNYAESLRTLEIIGEEHALTTVQAAYRLSIIGRPKIAIVSDGEKGVCVADGENRVVYHADSLRVAPAAIVSTLGAGDGAASAGVSEWLRGSSPELIAAAFAANGANIIQYPGANEGGLNREEIEAVLLREGREFNITEVYSAKKRPGFGAKALSLAAAASLFRR